MRQGRDALRLVARHVVALLVATRERCVARAHHLRTDFLDLPGHHVLVTIDPGLLGMWSHARAPVFPDGLRARGPEAISFTDGQHA